MRICFLNQAPKRSAAYETKKIEAQLNGYASPGTKIEIVFPDFLPMTLSLIWR